MRLTFGLYLIVGSWMSGVTFAQTINEESMKTQADQVWLNANRLKNVQADFLISYYEQDGNRSPVTGGRGTQKLTDVTPTLVVSVPIGPRASVAFDFGVDIYTSASTDNIDTESGESRKDERKHVNLSYSALVPSSRLSYSVGAGISDEYDVISYNLAVDVSKESRDGNRLLGFKAQAFFDTWDIYPPSEFRTANPVAISKFGAVGILDDDDDDDDDDEDDPIGTDNRTSLSGELSFFQVISPKIQMGLTVEGVYQSGLLSTPFHRVFLNDGVDVGNLGGRSLITTNKQRAIERLPRTRFKLPVGVQFHAFPLNWLITRFQYRFYWDDWGITAHTIEGEFPLKLSAFFSVIPGYRFHTQSEADDYFDFGEAIGNERFLTSDTDLSALDAHKFSLGFRYAPAFGIGSYVASTKNARSALLSIKGFDLRGAYYTQDNGLDAYIVSFGITFTAGWNR